MSSKSTVFCPVGNHVALGYLTKGKVCIFICRECRYVFTWDKHGKLLAPEKLEEHGKKSIRYCDSGGCYCHD